MSTDKPHRRLIVTQPSPNGDPDPTPVRPDSVEGTERENGEPGPGSLAAVLRNPALRRDAYLVVPLGEEGRRSGRRCREARLDEYPEFLVSAAALARDAAVAPVERSSRARI